MMRRSTTIPLSGTRGRGLVATIDAGDRERVLAVAPRWYLANRGQCIVADVWDMSRGHRRRRCVKLHRIIINAPRGTQVDHRNGDVLDNSRVNLRLCSNSENQRNRHRTRGVSRFKGVVWHKGCNKWEARLNDGKKRHYLGLFSNEADAARAYNESAQKHFGDFACLNEGVAT